MPVQEYGYVPLPITIDRGIKNQWHVERGTELSAADGISITVSCEDLKGAIQFINDLLDEEILKLRYWGIEGINYNVYENGVYYRTPEQRERARNLDYSDAHFCIYSYFPRIEGMLSDGINAFSHGYQADEFLSALAPDVRECMAAYKCRNYVEMLGTNSELGPWYPMYSYSEMLTPESEAGRVWEQMKSVKNDYLPRVVMTEDFEGIWQQYIEHYRRASLKSFLRKCKGSLSAG